MPNRPVIGPTDFNIPPPNLPVININACPQLDPKGAPISVKLAQDQGMYASWQDKHSMTAMLKADEEVDLLDGIEVIREPDQAKLTQSGAEMLTQLGLPSKEGDIVFRYGLRDGGNWDLWASGAWFQLYYEVGGGLNSSCGFADKSQCMYTIVKDGVKEWWIKVRTSNNRVGWMLTERWKDCGNFWDICGLD